MNGHEARSIVILLETGEADGPRVAHLPMSTIRAFAFQREDMPRALELFEARWKKAGAYILFGNAVAPQGNVEEPTVYIGESEQVSNRVRNHYSQAGNAGADNYAYWANTIVLVSDDDSLSKGHVRHIESELFKLAAANGEWEVKSGRDPADGAGGLPRHDAVPADRFVAEARLLCGVLGLDVFKLQPVVNQPVPPPADVVVPAAEVAPVPVFILQANQMHAPARMQPAADSTFLVLEDSGLSPTMVASLHPGYRKLRETLAEQGVIAGPAGQLRFTRDHAFRSIAAVTQVVSGTTLNGRVAWATDGGESYGQWEAAQIGE